MTAQHPSAWLIAEQTWADLGPPAGRRPVCVITRDAAGAVLTAITCAPITRTQHPSEIDIESDEGLPELCVVNCDTIVTVPVDALDREPVGTDGTRRVLVPGPPKRQIFVVGVAAFVRGSDVPRDLSDADEMYGGGDDFMSRGNTAIVAPGGELIAGPLIGEAGAVTAELDLSRIAAGRRMFDPTGHYSRPDVLSLRQPATI